MKKRHTRYTTAMLALVASLALSPVSAKTITICGVSIHTAWWAADACYGAINSAIATCSVPVDGGVACATSIAFAAWFCEDAYHVVKACID